MKRKTIFNIVTLLFFSLPLFCSGQSSFQKTIQLPWKEATFSGNQIPKLTKNDTEQKPGTYHKIIQLPKKPSKVRIEPTFTFEKSPALFPDSFTNSLSEQFNLSYDIGYYQKKPRLKLSINPLKVNGKGGINFIQTVNLSVNFKKNAQTLNKQGEESDWPNQSKLASGDWYKLAIDTTGVFKITHQLLKDLGLNPSNINPKQLQVFGSGGDMLPQSLSKAYPKGLQEVPIHIKGGDDGSFDNGDFILFYGQGPVNWHYDSNSNTYNQQKNYYSNKGFYFLTAKDEKGKRIKKQKSLSGAPYTTNRFDELYYHEKEQFTEINEQIKTGRDWYGEIFDEQSKHSFQFNLNSNPKSLLLKYGVAHRSPNSSTFSIKFNGSLEKRLNISKVRGFNDYESDYIENQEGSLKRMQAPKNLKVSFTYNKRSSSKGWLDFLALRARTRLDYKDNYQLIFKDHATLAQEKAQYNLKNANNALKIWDVTNQWDVHSQAIKQQNGKAFFTDSSNELREYIAFESNNTYQPDPIGSVNNQNLHGLSPAKMIIVTHDQFSSQAKELAEFHRKKDNFSVHVVTPQTIYQEFSSGRQDITGIRNFLKMLYDKADNQAEQPEYLLLFGDASYDYKDRIDSNTNLVPTYQSKNCYSPTNSFATDDYYAYLDDNEGSMADFLDGATHYADLAVGRIPVNEKAQAKTVLKKIKNYHNDSRSLGSWQNLVTLVGDDEDDNRHLSQAEDIANLVNKYGQDYTVDKIYLDAYEQKTTPSGTRYPDVNEAINSRINNGTLVFNYIGHGGEKGLAQERVVQLDDIKKWENNYRLPLFVTATCEYSRFDDPNLTSAGERTLFKKGGGAIGLFSTTRLVFIGQNGILNKNLFRDNIFQQKNGQYKRLGKIIQEAKKRIDHNKNVGYRDNTRKFALLGDPALKLAYPKHDIETTQINNKPFSSDDSLKALQEITLKGKVKTNNGELLKDFNGTINPTIFDKKIDLKTLANDPDSRETTFKLRNSIIYDGKAKVKNGKFNISFVVPKDIAYTKGQGKISYYANDQLTDANGHDFIQVGGTAENPISDDQPPRVDLHINDRNFEDGGITSSDPLLLADIFEDYGINTAANGIGHQPRMILDGDESKKLPDAYQASFDSTNTGTLKHQLKNLEPGKHYLKLKVWDVANNSGEDEISFIVKDGKNVEIRDLLNYPNPFANKTNFQFKHNQDGKPLTITLQVFDTKGNHHRTLKQKVIPEGNQISELSWNGRNSNGKQLSNGVYIYRLKIKSAGGKVAHSSNKLVIQK